MSGFSFNGKSGKPSGYRERSLMSPPFGLAHTSLTLLRGQSLTHTASFGTTLWIRGSLAIW